VVTETEKISIFLLFINGLNKKMKCIFNDLAVFLMKMEHKFYLAKF